MDQSTEYQIIKELGQGAQGAVYLVKDLSTMSKYAAKIYAKHDRFKLEEEILQKIKSLEGFPQIQDVTEIDDHSMIVMEVLGDNLRTLKDRNNGKISLHTALQIMHQIINRLEMLHEKGYVHCDLKPDNILISLSITDSNIYLVDFGLAHRYKDQYGNHIKQPKKVNFKGSISYCSLNLLNKQYPSRRDDLESLIYVILFMYLGQLPWHDGAQQLRGQERLNYVIKMKQDLNISQYGDNIPKSIIKCYKYIRKLAYDEKPDYNKLKYFILKDLENHGLTINGVYDWTDTRDLLISHPSYPILSNEMIMKSIYEREYQKISIENASMEADYKDFMSIEFDENVSVSLKELSPKKNMLSSLSPNSRKSTSQEDMSEQSFQQHINQSPISKKKTFKQMSSFNIRGYFFPGEEMLVNQNDPNLISQEFNPENDAIDLKTRRGTSFKMSENILTKIQIERRTSNNFQSEDHN